MEYEDFFTNRKIIKLLCRYRASIARNRHKNVFSEHIAGMPNEEERVSDFEKQLTELMPRRRQWINLNSKERSQLVERNERNSFARNKAILFKTIKAWDIKVKQGKEPPSWYVALQAFLVELKEIAMDTSSYDISEPRVIAKFKDVKKNVRRYRPIASYENLTDRILISQCSKYLFSKFDKYLESSSYAFRTNGITHHSTVKCILDYRSTNDKKDIWVAEGDISKFFDCVSHQKALETFREYSELIFREENELIDVNAKAIFGSFLSSYSFNHTVKPKSNNKAFFEEIGQKIGEFSWVESALCERFYPDGVSEVRLGIPQGGALSCLISNLILDSVDKKMAKLEDKELNYMRYCDDMIILDTDKENCRIALETYKNEVEKLNLIVHEEKQIEKYDKSFWKFKSKAPYHWSTDDQDESSVPWLAFVGYHIDREGKVRVRKSSLQKELHKQEVEVQKLVRILDAKNPENLNKISRKSRSQILYRLKQKFIAMSVGKIQLDDFQTSFPEMCWANGFLSLEDNPALRYQLKRLDKGRDKQLRRLNWVLQDLNVKNEETKDWSIVRKGGKKGKVKKLPKTYFGGPFSYFGLMFRSKPEVKSYDCNGKEA